MTHQHITDLVRRWIALLALGTFLAGAVSYVVSLQLPKVYEGTAMLLVTPSQPGTDVSSYNDVLSGQQLTRTYSEVLKTQPVVDQAATNAGLGLAYANALRLLDVKPIANTQLIQISARASTAALASSFANELARVFIEQSQATQSSRFAESESALAQQADALRQLVDDRTQRRAVLQSQEPSASRDGELIRIEGALVQLQQSYATAVHNHEDARLSAARARDLLTLVQPAPLPSTPVEPRIVLNVALATITGLILAAITAGVGEYIDDRLTTPERLARFTDLHSLAAITAFPKGAPVLVNQMTSSTAHSGDHVSSNAEAFSLLQANLRFVAIEQPVRTLLVTSPDAGDGKSTISANLAIVSAQAGQRVLLVDVDLRRPAQQRTFNVANRRGLTSLLIDPHLQLADVAIPSGTDGLSLVLTGPLPPNPSQLLASDRMRTRLAEFGEQFDLVVLDAAPALAVSDPAVLAAHADGVLLVINAEHTHGHAARQALALLRGAGGTMLGAVINRAKPQRGSYYGYYAYKPSAPEIGGPVNTAVPSPSASAVPSTHPHID